MSDLHWRIPHRAYTVWFACYFWWGKVLCAVKGHRLEITGDGVECRKCRWWEATG